MNKLTKLSEKQAAYIVSTVVHTRGCRNKANNFARLISDAASADRRGVVHRGDFVYRMFERNFGSALWPVVSFALIYEGTLVCETDDGGIKTSKHPWGIYSGFAITKAANKQLEEIANEIVSKSDEQFDLIF